MFFNPEQFTSATKALFESQIASFQALSSKTFEGVEKTIALNIAAAKASLEQSIAVTKQLSSAKDAQDFFSLTAAQAKLNAEKLASYYEQLTKATQQAAETVEAHVIDASEKFSHAVEKAAPVEKANPKAAKK